MIRAVYFHGIDGRMRIHIAGVKGSPVKAVEVSDRLGCFNGINNVNASPVTGNVLITYDSSRIPQWDILGRLREMGTSGNANTYPKARGPRRRVLGVEHGAHQNWSRSAVTALILWSSGLRVSGLWLRVKELATRQLATRDPEGHNPLTCKLIWGPLPCMQSIKAFT